MAGSAERVARHGVDGNIVLIDWPGGSGYRMDIYSPSDQPVTASAGVFSFEAQT